VLLPIETTCVFDAHPVNATQIASAKGILPTILVFTPRKIIAGSAQVKVVLAESSR
jgi:hypothetical protein